MNNQIDKKRMKKLTKKVNKYRKQFIKGYMKALFKRNGENELAILEDVCYQLYTYCEIKEKRMWYLKEKTGQLKIVGETRKDLYNDEDE